MRKVLVHMINKDLNDYTFQIHTIPFLASWTPRDKSLGVPPFTMLSLHMATHVLRDAFMAFYLILAFTVSVFSFVKSSHPEHYNMGHN